ncbi:hypothetical protein CAOG_07761 [Capsaspora owczarzaki ATCC 30864]|uniref:hypothetical protein n=2 Tax=Capsaspora owczarzaki (strain ATCC 30864) TaxID=595528 RepID=UPI0003521657|nr:hypothetical protein CAOG_07761 [Capsaspora owczarzaki ATCC 30864]|eukprot:XP_004342834.2 hypothetical protein CAOG_07761 [Capsaspora owczarzaki ATCC 30864]
MTERVLTRCAMMMMMMMNFWVFCPAFDPPTGGFITQQTCNNGKTAIAPPSLWTVAQAQDNEEDRWYCQSNLLKPGAANCPGNNPPRSCTNRNSITYGWLYQAISLSSFAKNSGYIDGTRVVVSFTAAFTNSNQHGGYLFLRIYNAANTVLGERWSNTLTTAGALTISTPLPAGSVSMNAYLSGFRNAGGSGPINAFFGSVYMTLAAAPMKQAGVFATAASYRSVDLSWSLVQNTQQSVSSFTVQYSTTANFASFQNVTGLSSSSTSYTVAGLTRNTLYYFRIYAVNSIGTSDPSDTKQATTLNLSFAGTGWGACSGCGGTQQMQYQCTDTVTNYADGTCTTNGVTKPTNTQPCNVIMSYAPVSPCSAACGATQTVTATAVLSNAVSPTACLQTQLQSCTGAPCPTNCAYASWPSFDPCSNCATLSITRTIATSAAFGGSACLDPSVSTSACSCTSSATPEVSSTAVSSISSSATSSVTPYVATSTPGVSVPAPTTSTAVRSSATSSISKSATPSASRLSSSRTATLASTTGGPGNVQNQTDSGSGFPLGAIIGAIAGIVLLAVIILFVIARRRKARESKPAASNSARALPPTASNMELLTRPASSKMTASQSETDDVYADVGKPDSIYAAAQPAAGNAAVRDSIYEDTQDKAQYAAAAGGSTYAAPEATYSAPGQSSGGGGEDLYASLGDNQDLYSTVVPAAAAAGGASGNTSGFIVGPQGDVYAVAAPGGGSSGAPKPGFTVGPRGDVYAVASPGSKADESLYDNLSPSYNESSFLAPNGDVYAKPAKPPTRG